MLYRVALLVSTVLLSACGEPAATADGEPVVLTVSGEITNPNRGPLDPVRDGMMTIRGMEFDRAREFTLSDLKALEPHTLSVAYSNWSGERQFTGAALADVLMLAGAQGTTLEFQALDGYGYAFQAAEIASDFLLAYEMTGNPLDLGGYGPLWLVMPTDRSPAGPESDEGLVWALYSIHIVSP